MKKGGGKEERSDRTAAVRGRRRWQREGVVTPQQPQGSGGYEATEGDDDDDDSHCHGDEGDAGDDGGAGHSDGHGFWVGLTTHLTPVFTVKRS